MLQISTGRFRSYLSDHTQNVRVGENVSCSLPISIWTFQGTCLGPLLFNIATNDFNSYIPKEIDVFRITTVPYADDSQIAITGPRKSMSEMRIALEKILDVVDTWFLQNGMLINAAKTELLLSGDRRQLAQISESPEITFKGESLKITNQVNKPRCNYGQHTFMDSSRQEHSESMFRHTRRPFPCQTCAACTSHASSY